MTITLYRKLGYFGFTKQSAQGSGSAPVYFAKLLDAAYMPSQKISDYRNGNVLDVGFSVKETFHYAGRIKTPLFATEAGAILAYHLGADTKTGGGDPYTHALSYANAIPYVSAEVSAMENQILDRVIDSKVGRVVIEAEAGKMAFIESDWQGCSVAVQGSPATVSFSDAAGEGPMMLYHGTLTLSGPTDYATAAGQVRKVTIESDRNLSLEYGPGYVYPIAIFEQGRKVTFKMTVLFSGPALYNLTHYGGSAGTTVSPVLGTGSAVLVFNTGASPERSITITLANVTWQLAKPTGGLPDGSTGLLEVEAVGYRSGATLPLAVSVKNGVSTAYV